MSAAAANPTLKGHKLLIFKTPQFSEALESLKERVRARFTDLAIAEHEIPMFVTDLAGLVPAEAYQDVTILQTFFCLPQPEEVPKLVYVQLASAGAEHIVKHPLFRTDAVFCSASGIHGPQISEWVISTFLVHQHFLVTHLDHQREAKWVRDLKTLVPQDCVGQRVGILGYGSIGRQIARVARALGMDVHAFTLNPRDTPESRRDHGWAPEGLGDPQGEFPSKWFSGSSKEDLHTFLSSGLDLLVVAMPLTPLTTGMLGKPEFEILSARATYVSNIGRGAIIKTDDLIEALEAEKIRGAALDVTDPEPLPDGHPLWRAKNVTITPHVSGGSSKYMERVLGILETNLARLSEGKRLLNEVNKTDGYSTRF